MILTELQIYQSTSAFVPHSPFTFKSIFGAHTTADYWVTTFGATGDTNTSIKSVNSVVIEPNIFLSRSDTLVNCQNTAQTFYYDFATQILYVHPPHTINMSTAIIQAGVAIGATNGDVVLVGNIQYSPLIRSVPSVQQKEDLIKYNKLAFLSGKVVFSNVNGEFDDIITSPIYGNELNQYYLPNGKYEYDRSELVPLASYFVEDYDFTLQELSINVQDKRKGQNANILITAAFSVGTGNIESVPLLYGNVRAIQCLLDEAEGTTGNVNYRAAESLTDFGTIQYWSESTKKWATVAATVSTTLATGRFVVSAANGREGGSSSGTPLKFRLLEPIGATAAKPTDIIKDLNARAGIVYNTANYDQTEWTAATTALSTIGVLFNRQTELYEAIRQIQAGSYPGFRYEVKADGRRSARVNDWNRAVSENISWFDIKDNLRLKVSTDSKVFAASIDVKYDKNYESNTFLTKTNSVYAADALATYRQSPTLSFDSMIPDEATAILQAEWWAARLSKIRGIVEVELHGQQYYTMRIYDIITIELCTENRTYFGTWKAQILSVNPKFDGLSNAVTAVLIEQLEC